MPGRMYRGTAFAKMVQDMLRKQYYGEMPGEWGRMGRQYFKMQRPVWESMFKDYMGGAAGLGQAVPGEGLSSAAMEGLVEDLMGSFLAQSAGATLGAAQMPWHAAFGAAPTAGGIAGIQSQRDIAKMGQIGQGFTGGMQAVSQICGFAFIEADNGVLDRIARRYQKEEGTFEQRIGYKIFCALIVPLMRKHKMVKNLIKWTMVRPMIWWGRAFYGENKWGHAFYPVAQFWLRNFEALGRKMLRGVN